MAGCWLPPPHRCASRKRARERTEDEDEDEDEESDRSDRRGCASNAGACGVLTGLAWPILPMGLSIHVK